MSRATNPPRSRPGVSLMLPKGIFAALRRQPPPIRVAPILVESASLTSDAVYQRLRSRATGLTAEEAEARLAEHGPNVVAADGSSKSIWLLLWHAVVNPLVLLLAVLATDLLRDGRRAGRDRDVSDDRAGRRPAADPGETSGHRRGEAQGDDLGHRDGRSATAQPQEMPVSQLVPGDVVQLAAGDMIPGDVRIVAGQGPVRHPGLADRRIVSRREVRGRQGPAAGRRRSS